MRSDTKCCRWLLRFWPCLGAWKYDESTRYRSAIDCIVCTIVFLVDFSRKHSFHAFDAPMAAGQSTLRLKNMKNDSARRKFKSVLSPSIIALQLRNVEKTRQKCQKGSFLGEWSFDEPHSNTPYRCQIVFWSRNQYDFQILRDFSVQIRLFARHLRDLQILVISGREFDQKM